MTYTYKLARRLAISRNLAMVNALAAASGVCGRYHPAPEAPAIPGIPRFTERTHSASVSFPARSPSKSISPVRFRGELQSFRGQVFSPPPGVGSQRRDRSIPAEPSHAGRPGTYRVVGRGNSTPAGTTRSVPTPRSSSWAPRQPPASFHPGDAARPPARMPARSRSFKVVGRLNDGSHAAGRRGLDRHGRDHRPVRRVPRGSPLRAPSRSSPPIPAGTLSDTVRVKVARGRMADTTPSPNPDPTPQPEPEPEPEPQPETGTDAERWTRWCSSRPQWPWRPTPSTSSPRSVAPRRETAWRSM